MKIINLIVIIKILLLLTFLNSCGKKNIETKEQNSLKSFAKSNKSWVANSLRMQIIRDTALSTGARGGLAFRTKQIQKTLFTYQDFLDRIFNFQPLLIEGILIPPVLIEAHNALQLTGNDVIRLADHNYKIINQAKFVTVPPNWREYLLKSFETPETPDKSLLPKNSAEQAIWEKYIDQGWREGINQANSILKENLNILTRDLKGMILYRKLLARRMITPPFVSSIELGITGDHSNLTVNDKIFKITAFPSLQIDGSKWKTEIIPNE